MGRDRIPDKNTTVTFNFNSHARVGRDRRDGYSGKKGGKFQLTRPRGARHLMNEIPHAHIPDFNSHARVGRDRRSSPALRPYTPYFNSHARVGRDMMIMLLNSYFLKDFNSHARVGRDMK